MKRYLVLALFFVIFIPSTLFAAWSGNPYSIGETLNPECAPTDINCTVNPGYSVSNGNFGIGTDTPSSTFNVLGTTTLTGTLQISPGTDYVNNTIELFRFGSDPSNDNDGTPGALIWNASKQAIIFQTINGSALRLESGPIKSNGGISSNSISVDDGSIYGPSITFSNHPGTGLSWGANDSLVFSAGTIPSMSLDSGGLEVAGIGSFGDNVRSSYFTATSSTASVFPYASTTAFTVSGASFFPGNGIWNESGSVGIGSTTPFARLAVTGSATDATNAFTVADSNNTPLFNIQNNGNVGIGSSTPSEKLTISGGNIVQTASSTLTYRGTHPFIWLANGVSVSGNYAYGSYHGWGFAVLDISTSTNRVGYYINGGGFSHILSDNTVSGQYAYLAYGDAGLVIVDISNPNAITTVSVTPITGNSATAIAVSGHYAYVGSSNTMAVVDISNPKSPVVVGTYSTPSGIYHLKVLGKYVYTLNTTSVSIIDVSNPTNPVSVSTINGISNPSSIDITQNKTLFVTETSNGLYIYNVSDPTNPSLVSQYAPATMNIYGIAVSGNYAYLGIQPNSGNGIIQTLDISNVYSPVLIASTVTNTTSIIANIAVSGKKLVVTEGFQGVYTFDMSGLTTNSADIGSLNTSHLSVTGDLNVQGIANFNTGLNLGGMGLFSSGPISSYIAATTSSATSTSATFMGGNVAIGTSSPYALLSIQQSSNYAQSGLNIAASNYNNRSIYMNTSNVLNFEGNGNIASLSSAGAWVNASDVSYKKDITPIKYTLKDIMSLQPRSYIMKSDGSQQIGFIAQEMEKVVPEVVDGEEGHKGIAYGQLTALSISGTQELSKILGITFDSNSVAKSSRLDTIESRLAGLEIKLSDSTTTDTTITTKITDYLASIGAAFQDGAVYIKNLAVGKFTVGSRAKPTGITMFDISNGNPYCAKIHNGIMETVPGECTTESFGTQVYESVTPTTTPIIIPLIIPPTPSSTPPVTLPPPPVDTGSTTPPVTPPTPDPAPADPPVTPPPAPDPAPATPPTTPPPSNPQ